MLGHVSMRSISLAADAGEHQLERALRDRPASNRRSTSCISLSLAARMAVRAQQVAVLATALRIVAALGLQLQRRRRCRPARHRHARRTGAGTRAGPVSK
jgi:hypothetical protein